MSNVVWKLEDELCRCCHSEGTFSSLSKTHNFGNGEEIYVDVLRYALDININPVMGALCAATYAICESCTGKLQEALHFKRQVLICEEKFNDMYLRSSIKVAEVKIKDEPDDNQNSALDNFTVEDDDFHIKDDQRDVDFENEDIMSEMWDNDGKELPKKKQTKLIPQKTKKAQKKTVKRKRKTFVSLEQPPDESQMNIPQKFCLRDDDYTQQGDLYHCSKCDKRYDKIESLKFHVKTKHYRIPRYICPYCKMEFMTMSPFTIHKLEQHNIDDRFKCNACKNSFNTKIQLTRHLKSFHMMGVKQKCDFCDYECFSFEGMYKHKYKHKTVKDYHCRFCKKSFLRKTTLDLHERIHTGDRRKVCKVCCQAFVQKASLNYHMTKYHPEVNF